MKYIGLIIIILILYAGFYLARIFYYSHYSPLPKIETRDTTIGKGPNLKYIAAGDSTAVGIGASSTEQTYAYKLAKQFSQNNRVEYKNIAVSGARTEDVINSQLSRIIEFQPDIVTISIGANDLTHLISSSIILENYKKIISEVQTQTKAKIYITNIPNFTGAKLLPFWYVSIIENKSKDLNKQLLALETEQIKIINIHDFGWDKFPDKSITYSADNFHPNDIGYQNWADAFLDKIK